MKFNNLEEEVIVLKAVNELIDKMVNFEVGELLGNGPHFEFHFKSMTHQKYFNIMLLDFLSDIDFKILGRKSSYMETLKAICDSPGFGNNDFVKSLNLAIKDFSAWLEKEIVVEKVWLLSIDLEINLSIKRVEFIKICGNISKHNFSRLASVVKKLIGIFQRNNIKLKNEKALLILNEFYEWFHTHIFNYHGSAIAEFLNNLRWGIYEYLRPESERSIVYEGDEHPRMYENTFPAGIIDDFAKNCYRDLMNDVRSAPYMRKFQVTRYLKMRH